MPTIALIFFLSFFTLDALSFPTADGTLTLNCNFVMKFYDAKQLLTCEALNFNNDDENGKVGKVLGENLSRKSQSDVQALIIGGKLKFLPTNLNEIFPNLERIQVENSKLEKIKRENFNGLNLQVLKLSKNSIKFIESDAFENQKSLKKIHLDRNEISQIDDKVFTFTPQLEILQLENNNLKTLSENLFQNLPELKKISLADNKIEKLTAETFKNNQNLENLDVSNNKLKFINSKILTDIKSLKKINFYGNSCLRNLEEGEIEDLEKLIDDFCNEGEIFNPGLDTTRSL